MEENKEEHLHHVIKVEGLYQNWFLDYASYVILDRAVPHIDDGLKPVQRRILHSLKELDDGRFNKAANVIGNTMKYHPHGDASIGDAMVQIGQKNLLIDCQGNWGNIYTGDDAAAPRYIEARLSKFANEVVFNADTTTWQLSYDGRNQEPLTLPVKFPLLLAQGVEGIAVGLATKILPHNFIELINASIEILNGKSPEIFPDFATGGFADFSKYNNGLRGGKVRVRAKISERDKKTLVITEIPFGCTTVSLIDSIISANDKGKIKLKKIEDNTAKDVEILLHLAPGISPDVTIDALYAFTDCEISISPNSCVIEHDKPHFLGVTEILKRSTQKTKALLKQELEIKLHDLMEKIFFSSLLKIFIGEGMYKHKEYENANNFEIVEQVLQKLFAPFVSKLYREIQTEDLKKLIDKPMSSITRFDVKKADEQMRSLEEEIKQVKHHLKHLNDFTIAYFEKLKEKYGAGRERKTEIRVFDTVQAAQVALANVKLYVNRAEGFVGYGLKKDEYICDCSDIDDIIAFRSDGKFMISKVSEKVFMGKDLIHVNVFKKNDDRTVYNVIYRDGESGKSFIKRFNIGGITRDKEYDLSQGTKGSSILYFTANPNGEAEVVTLQHKPVARLRKLTMDIDFAEIAIKGRGSIGNTLTKYPVKKVLLKNKGVSTLGGRDIWYDETLKRLNTEKRGKYLGSFSGEDKILAIYADGTFELTNFDLSNHYDDNLGIIEKFNPEKVITAIHYDAENKSCFVKRFNIEITTINKKTNFISESPGSKILFASTVPDPIVEVNFVHEGKSKPEAQTLNLAEFIEVKGMKAMGNKISKYQVAQIKDLTPPPIVESAESESDNGDDDGMDDDDGQLGLFKQ